ncbi:trehalose-phosphatase [Microvirga flavescens]|uniref:trehalose-phosphatase n=1 Tax=Microvirga flavescens TaxID=2249811 RepID=UPI001FE020A1|nr:trehalose-phosphatase [Microvirga flavescens]
MAAAEQWALFLDFDGTLVDIVERPDAVVVDQGLRDVLSGMKDRLGGALAIISGRPIAFLDTRLAPYRFDIAGLHGLEYRIGKTVYLCQPEDHPRLRGIVPRLQDVASAKSGVLVEDKGCSVAVHWRLAPQERDFVLATVNAAAEALGPEYRIQLGKAVAELLPAAAGKGKVIESFLRQAPYRGRRPIFVGDDLTDENGFNAVNALDGISVRIGDGNTVAQKRLQTPAALRQCLSAWVAGGVLPLMEEAGA